MRRLSTNYDDEPEEESGTTDSVVLMTTSDFYSYSLEDELDLDT